MIPPHGIQVLWYKGHICLTTTSVCPVPFVLNVFMGLYYAQGRCGEAKPALDGLCVMYNVSRRCCPVHPRLLLFFPLVVPAPHHPAHQNNLAANP